MAWLADNLKVLGMMMAGPSSFPHARFDVVHLDGAEELSAGRTLVVCCPLLGLLACVGPPMIVGEPEGTGLRAPTGLSSRQCLSASLPATDTRLVAVVRAVGFDLSGSGGGHRIGFASFSHSRSYHALVFVWRRPGLAVVPLVVDSDFAVGGCGGDFGVGGDS